jgi:hypothetical protein
MIGKQEIKEFGQEGRIQIIPAVAEQLDGLWLKEVSSTSQDLI